jgi:hypothetical protein
MGATNAILILIFFGQLILAMSIPNGRSYKANLNNIEYQLSRVADNLGGIRRELELIRQAMLYISQEEHNETDRH